MAEVYIVTRGEYSDYRIFAVYLDKEMAEATALAYNGDREVEWGGYRVETHVVGEAALKPNWAARVDLVDGVIKSGDATAYIADEDMAYLVFWRQPAGPGLDPHRTPESVKATLRVEADTKERALKVVSERAAQIAADWDRYLTGHEGQYSWVVDS